MASSIDQSSDISFEDDVHSTVLLTPTTTVADPQDFPERPVKVKTSIPCRGKTFLIRDTKSGHVLSLSDGKISLLPSNQLGSAIYWSCHETNGWLGFKNLASGEYLSYYPKEHLTTQPAHRALEYFCLRMVRKGGYVMLAQVEGGEKLWPVQVLADQGLQRLAKADIAVEKGVTWEFIEA
ncbi:hypothetical protein P171DRAFT_516718 [Karstenula rhodostoma CBS 690.94]|uniref:Uncharacterized protein n=1 Tax=Karstenula rhodostoma CBS 690.94 TaxID=1392251 RepID=A0A9P4PVC0_9PLEO|nr:hypothetical protein P171DRAFT_516718 [Karstenula rhodostoma CBS 690.94]